MPRREVIQMPIRWSALQVSEALDEVEGQMALAKAFLDAAKAKVREARTIPKLAGYMDDRLGRISFEIIRIEERIAEAIASTRKAIPEGAVERDRKRGEIKSMF